MLNTENMMFHLTYPDYFTAGDISNVDDEFRNFLADYEKGARTYFISKEGVKVNVIYPMERETDNE